MTELRPAAMRRCGPARGQSLCNQRRAGFPAAQLALATDALLDRAVGMRLWPVQLPTEGYGDALGGALCGHCRRNRSCGRGVPVCASQRAAATVAIVRFTSAHTISQRGEAASGGHQDDGWHCKLHDRLQCGSRRVVDAGWWQLCVHPCLLLHHRLVLALAPLPAASGCAHSAPHVSFAHTAVAACAPADSAPPPAASLTWCFV